MVKPYWLAVMFVAGVVVGAMFARPHAETAGSTVAPTQKLTAQNSPPAQVSEAGPAGQPAAAAHVAREPGVPAKAANEPAPLNTQPDSSAAAYGGYSQAIDVGPVFREQFAEAQAHGLRNPLLEFHQNLEREVRNDSWAYSAEADIQNSLVADTSAGNFNLDHLECRATICEVRLSARGKDQSEALTRWQQQMRTQPWGSQLEPRTFSSVGRNDDADVLVIFTRPEKKAPEKATRAS